MKKTIALAAFAFAAAAFAVNAQDKQTATANFVDAKGKETGRAHLTSGNDGVLFEVEVSGLEPRRWVALHIHETGNCDDHAEGHKASGGHFNPGGKEHGFLAANGPHAGDLIAEVTVLMEFGGSAEDLARTCHAHPTLAEAVKEAALAVDKRPIHM